MLLGLPKQILARVGMRAMSPADVISQIGVSANWRVLELGNPVGFFAEALHRVIGEAGTIIVAGPNPESLEKLHDEVDHGHTQTTDLGDVLVGRSAPAHSLDLIILTNALSNMAHADNFLPLA